MQGFYLYLILTILLSEYGFQSRKKAVQGFHSCWKWRRSIYRLLMWVILIILSRWYLSPGPLVMVLAAFIAGEIIVLVTRTWIRRDMQEARPFGAPWVHVLPFVLGLLALLLLKLGGDLVGFEFPPMDGLPKPRIILFALSFISLWAWATMITVSVVQIVRPEQLEEEISPSVGAGELIGILERLTTFTLVIAGGLVAVGFVVAVKAAVRFPLFENKEFAEYFLIGTLCSVGLAILAGLPLALL